MSREEFRERMLREHAPLVLAQPLTGIFVRRYAQLHNIGSTQKDPEGSKIDAVSVLAFASMNDVEDYLLSDDHVAIEASENALAGDGSEWWTAINYSIINRLAPEVPTAI
ncbi:EthD domain-containing protein [Sphingomonas aerolata]